MREAYSNIESKGSFMALKISTGKFKYMKPSAAEARRREQNITIIGDNNFKAVNRFLYLGSTLNHSNYISGEINRRIMASNCVYVANISHFKSNLLSKGTKIKFL